MYKIVPHAGSFRIVQEGLPAWRYCEQHGDRSVAEERLAHLNRKAVTRPKPVTLSEMASVGDDPAAVVEAMGDAADADLSVLDGTLANLARELGTGAHDPYLSALLAAEEAGKTRKGAVRILQSRLDEITAD